MEVYRSEAAEILRRFRNGRLTQKECVAALNDALAAFVVVMKPEDLPAVRDGILADRQAVKDELARRCGIVRD